MIAESLLNRSAAETHDLGLRTFRVRDVQLWNIEDGLLILYGRWLLFMYARQQPLGNRAERCYANVQRTVTPLPSISPSKQRPMLHSWDEKAYKYTIAESTASSRGVEELDEHVFVLRVRIGEYLNSA